ncbi:MAG: dephospho-CoA kinase [Candidatus Marinimicrobia bacterium]|nr:dephospho-CoA kinase [Candidatus Neomarinimicrobiota bacterium]
MYILGVTGSIGSGKSTASARLADLGAVVSHSDNLAKEILQDNKEILAALSDRFGSDILDNSGTLQRHILAERAFASREDQLFLNHSIHPEVKKITLMRIETARAANKPMFVIDAPLLFEAHVDSITDSVLVIAADRIFRQGRVGKRSQISTQDFERREALQMPIEEKIRRAQHVIYNDGSLDELQEKVDLLYSELIH